MTPEPNPDNVPSVETPILQYITPGRVALIAAIIALIPYLLTLNQTFGFVDKGEMVAVASTLGISHPTGYPTIMMLGFLFTLLLPVRDVLALNIMAALLTAGSVATLTLLFDDLLRRISAPILRVIVDSARGKGKRKGKGAARKTDGGDTPERSSLAPPLRALYAGLASLLVAFTSTWWDQGNSFEVYSLHTLMMPLVTLLLLRYVDEEALRDGMMLPGSSATASENTDIGFTRRGIWFAVMLGLAFTNHLTTVLLAPAFLVYYFWTLGVNGRSILRWLYLAPLFAVGLLPYIYLPIRASMQPIFNWGDPDSIKRFIDHVSGKQYRVWMFESGDVYQQQTAFFFFNLPSQLAYAGLVLVIAGIIYLARRSVKLSVFVGLLFVACVVYSGGFDIMEIGPYYLTCIFAIGIWCLVGIAWLHERFESQVALPAAAFLVIAICVINYHDSDESGNFLVEDMTVNMLQTLPQNALILSAQWDFWLAGSWYMQEVEKMRPDVIVVDPELMRRSWYLEQLQHNHPKLMEPIKAEVDAFQQEVYKFEHDLTYDPATIQGAYVGMIAAMIERHIDERPVHITSEIDPSYSEGYVHVPYHLTLRLMRDSTYLPQEFPDYKFRFWENQVDPYAAKVYELYGRAIHARMVYEGQTGHEVLARWYANYLFTFDPGYTLANVPDAPLSGENWIKGMIGFFEEARGKLGPVLK